MCLSWRLSDIILKFIREHKVSPMFLFPMLIAFWWIPGASFSFPLSILVLWQICRIFIEIHWPISKKQLHDLHLIPRDHETVDLMMQSFHWVVFSRTSIFLTVRLRAISTWYLVIALWTVVLLQLIRTEITHWVALLCTLLFEYLKMTVFYPFLMYKNLLKTILQNNFVDSKLFRTLCYSVSNLRMM